MNKELQLSAKSLQVLNLIAAGHSYSQIVDSNPGLTYHDVFFAAEEAVWLSEKMANLELPLAVLDKCQPSLSAMERSKMKHPRAYAPWSPLEDDQLKEFHTSGKAASEIATQLQRQPSAIRSRLSKLGLVSQD